MKVLLLHPEDRLPAPGSPQSWDLVVDLGRAPLSTYEEWGRMAGCRVISLYDFAEEIEDLYRVKNLLHLGMGQLVDRFGIDWWDVCSLLLIDDFLRFLITDRLSEELGNCELWASRPSPLADTILRRTGGVLHTLGTGRLSFSRRIRHYGEAFGNLDSAQLIQVLQDKFDPEHSLRSRFAPRAGKSQGPVTLLPSGYINVSRMAVAYAAMLPDEHFLLVCSRNIAKLDTLPSNVQAKSLDAYFSSGAIDDSDSLVQRWDTLKSRLLAADDKFRDADACGALARIPGLVRSGVAVRNAWNWVFREENVTGCFSTDDTAPDSRIPLIIAQNRGLPATACHHGALDSRMAIKNHYADFYLAKGEMERNYLARVCRMPAKKLVTGGPASTHVRATKANSSSSPWIVFFTEPYQVDAWRSDEVYRDLLPRLCALAKECGLQLVFKLHPFESAKSIRRIFGRYLSAPQMREIQVVTGPISSQLWRDTRFALTVQSTVALECCERNIPIFLCGWLRSPFGGYIEQYDRFGIGCRLKSPEQISEIPRLLGEQTAACVAGGEGRRTIDPLTLRNLLHGTYSALSL